MVIKILSGEEKMNKTIYGSVPVKALRNNFSDIINQVYKLLPLKEESNIQNLIFTSLLFYSASVECLLFSQMSQGGLQFWP